MIENKKADKILNTTIKLFLRDGVKKITMDDIAEKVNMSKVTIYKYFTDKDTLYLEAAKSIFTEYIDQLKRIPASGEELIKKMYSFLYIICDFTDSRKLELCEDLAKYNDAVEAEYAQYLQAYRQLMITLVEEGTENSLFKGNLDKNMIFYYIDMGVAYYQKNTEYRNKLNNDNGFQQKFMQFYIGNIFADEAYINGVTGGANVAKYIAALYRPGQGRYQRIH